MKSYKIKYLWFKLIKSFDVTAKNDKDAEKEFKRLKPYIQNKYILKTIQNEIHNKRSF